MAGQESTPYPQVSHLTPNFSTTCALHELLTMVCMLRCAYPPHVMGGGADFVLCVVTVPMCAVDENWSCCGVGDQLVDDLLCFVCCHLC